MQRMIIICLGNETKVAYCNIGYTIISQTVFHQMLNSSNIAYCVLPSLLYFLMSY